MGFIFGLIKLIFRWTLYITIFGLILILIPNLPPYCNFSSIQLDPALPREGPLSPNDVLSNAKHLFKNKLNGPEAFEIYNDELYTGLSTGEVVKISPKSHLTFVTKIGEPCHGDWDEHKCGRPLGLRIDANGKYIYVSDAYYGIWKVDLKSDRKQLLVSPRTPVEGLIPKIFNSIALAKNGDFYWTDSSSDFSLKDGFYTLLADPVGRLLKYNAARNSSEVLYNGLWFSNGLVVSPDDQYVLVSETAGSRILRYYINGPKKHQKDVFLTGLPGTPDNIQPLPDGSGMLVALYTVFDEQHPVLTRSMAQVPAVRKFLARLLRLIEIPFEFLEQQFPHYIFQQITYTIGNFKSVAPFLPPISGLLHVDWNGNIVASYYSTSRSMMTISDAVVFQDMLYLGSPHNDFIGAVPAPENLKRAFSSSIKTLPPKTAEHVTINIPEKIEPKPKVAKPEPKIVKVEEPKVIKLEEPKVSKQKEPQVGKPKEGPQSTVQVPPTKETLKVETKPNVEQKVADSPKQTPQQPKEQAKPVETKDQKPANAKPVITPATEKPVKTKQQKPANAKPVITPATEKPVETKQQKPAHPKPVITPVTEKPVHKPVTKSDEPKAKIITEQLPRSETAKSSDAGQKPKNIPEHIPIKEEIPSDTAKPNKENLKVITKGGPTEIPNPN